MGNVYMEADQVRFKNSTYHNLQTAVAAALEGGGGGGTTVVANPEGSATADLSKLQVGTTIYGIPADAADIGYNNTTSGMTADDVQEAIDELNTGIGGITELIPSDATSSNKLATAGDIPGVATTSAPGIVQPDGTTITIDDGVISAVGGSSGFSYIETDSILLNDLTWSGTGDEMRSAILTDAIPANVKVISIALIGFGYLNKTNIFQYTQSGVSPRNIIILAPDNTFQQYASIKLRITCAPAT